MEAWMDQVLKLRLDVGGHALLLDAPALMRMLSDAFISENEIFSHLTTTVRSLERYQILHLIELWLVLSALVFFIFIKTRRVLSWLDIL